MILFRNATLVLFHYNESFNEQKYLVKNTNIFCSWLIQLAIGGTMVLVQFIVV